MNEEQKKNEKKKNKEPLRKYNEKNIFASIFESYGKPNILFSRFAGVPTKSFRIDDLEKLIILCEFIIKNQMNIKQAVKDYLSKQNGD